MNAKYIYDIFETAEKNNVDLTIGLEILKGTQPIPEGMTKEGISAFVGLHYDPLWRAYQTKNHKLFADILAVCEKGNEHEVDALLRAEATGNDKVVKAMEQAVEVANA